MRRPRLNALLLALAALALAALNEWGPHGLYRFGGHGQLLNDAVHGCLWLLFLTHVALAAIIWTQRERWDDAEGATFRFIGVKAIFWAFAALTTPARNGINLSSTLLLVLIFATTLDLDVQLIKRYVLRKKETP